MQWQCFVLVLVHIILLILTNMIQIITKSINIFNDLLCQILKAHARYCHDNTNCGCLGQSLINDLATFLVCAKKYAYFNCNKNWLLNDTNFGWYEEYGKPLGAPNQENGVKVDDTYYRSFATGTGVIFNATSRQGRIFWSDEWDAWLLKQLDDRITDWYENIDTNYDLVDKRRIYMPEFDILL